MSETGLFIAAICRRRSTPRHLAGGQAWAFPCTCGRGHGDRDRGTKYAGSHRGRHVGGSSTLFTTTLNNQVGEADEDLMHVVLNGPYWTASTSPADYSGDGASVPAGSVCSAGDASGRRHRAQRGAAARCTLDRPSRQSTRRPARRSTVSVGCCRSPSGHRSRRQSRPRSTTSALQGRRYSTSRCCVRQPSRVWRPASAGGRTPVRRRRTRSRFPPPGRRVP